MYRIYGTRFARWTMWEETQQLLSQNDNLVAWTVGLSLLVFFGSLIAVPLAVVQMRSDYFVRTAEPKLSFSPLRLLRRLLKNALGLVLFLMGVAMLVLPGQGLLTILFGLSLLDFPGKRDLQLRLVRLKGVRRSIGWLRRRAEKKPLRLPDER